MVSTRNVYRAYVFQVRRILVQAKTFASTHIKQAIDYVHAHVQRDCDVSLLIVKNTHQAKASLFNNGDTTMAKCG